jgi:hypothetical protein
MTARGTVSDVIVLFRGAVRLRSGRDHGLKLKYGGFGPSIGRHGYGLVLDTRLALAVEFGFHEAATTNGNWLSRPIRRSTPTGWLSSLDNQRRCPGILDFVCEANLGPFSDRAKIMIHCFVRSDWQWTLWFHVLRCCRAGVFAKGRIYICSIWIAGRSTFNSFFHFCHATLQFCNLLFCIAVTACSHQDG